MAKTKCAQVVLLATMAAAGLSSSAMAAVPDGTARPDVTLSRAVSSSTPLTHLQLAAQEALAPQVIEDHDHDNGADHDHAHTPIQQARVSEGDFQV